MIYFYIVISKKRCQMAEVIVVCQLVTITNVGKRVLFFLKM